MTGNDRDFVRRRAGQRCEYCRFPQEFSELRFHVEHVLPRKHGGADVVDNLALACADCNLRKGPNLAGIDPLSQELTKLFNPRDQVWKEHFKWSGIVIEGITAVGRTTVRVLEINSHERLRVRNVLVRVDKLRES